MLHINREILFRGQAIETNNWVQGFYLKTKGKHFIFPAETEDLGFDENEAIGKPIEINIETLGQYTEYTDCKKTKLFNHDILQHNKDPNLVYEIIWNRNQACWWLSPITTTFKKGSILEVINNTPLGNGYFSRRDLRKIGNRFDNPEYAEI